MRKAAFLLAAVVALSVSPAAQPQQESGNEPPDLRSYNCAEHLRLAALEDGRSAIISVWAHGYYSGMRGVDEKSEPINWIRVEEFSRHIVTICRADPGKLFIRAVKEFAQTKAGNSNP